MGPTALVPNIRAADGRSTISDLGFEVSDKEIFQGRIARWGRILGRRVGFNSTTVFNDVGETMSASNNFPVLTGSETLTIVSTSASDTANGTGARTIAIVYFDLVAQAILSAVVTLTGVAPVTLPFKTSFIYGMEVSSAGSNLYSIGAISINNGGTLIEIINAGGTRSHSAQFLVPPNFTAYLLNWTCCSIGNATFDARIMTTAATYDRSIVRSNWVTLDTSYVQVAQNNNESLDWETCVAGTKIKVAVISSQAAAPNRVDTNIRLLMIQNQ